jgi:predicted ATPase
VWLAELAPLADPALVPAAIAAALGLEFPAGAVSAERVANALSGKELLLVLDNCEHVIDAAAGMAEALLRANPAVHVIATSREPLKAEGEWINPVPPLAAPAGAAQDQDDPLRYGAVRLFVERARAAARHFAPDRRLAALVAAICRRLDGIPLAIELAAATAADHFRQALDWRAGVARCPGNCGPPRALPGCCAIRVVPPTPWRSFSRSTTGSLMASTRPISKPQRH